MAVPKYDDLFNPILKALRELGGSASVTEMDDKVADILKLSDSEINEIHRGSRTKLSYRMAWARNYLKRFGLIENSSKGVWALTSQGNKTASVDKKEVNKFVKQQDRRIEITIVDDKEEEILWKDKLLEIMKKLSPSDFEKLCQRILREAGFIQVTVTGKTGDGGIDGTGLLRIGGFLSFRIIFQCKRYQGSVSSQQIREFKGTMAGRADKGLFITTGTFTKDAKAEAARDGSTYIDLIDGEQLVEKMKDLGLGVKIKKEETVEVNKDWFSGF